MSDTTKNPTDPRLEAIWAAVWAATYATGQTCPPTERSRNLSYSGEPLLPLRALYATREADAAVQAYLDAPRVAPAAEALRAAFLAAKSEQRRLSADDAMAAVTPPDAGADFGRAAYELFLAGRK
jgi:hypothetical protein